MKKVLLATAALFAFSSAAIAGGVDTTEGDSDLVMVSPLVMPTTLGGSIEVEIAENAAGDYAATTTFNAGIVAPGLAFGEIGVESVDGNTFEVNKWYIGTTVGGVGTVSFGDHDGGIFVESYSDYSTIAEPAMEEALIVSAGSAAVALGFTDVTKDVTDVSNVQGAYTLDAGIAAVTISADYNFNDEEYAIGTRTSGIELGPVELGSTLSYASATETLAYEMDVTMSYGLTAYVNGDDADALRNVGAGYTRDIGNLTVFTDVNYNIDTEELAPSAGITFSF